MTNLNYAVIIVSFGRATNVITYKTLRKLGYTGKIYLLCSDDDCDLDEYIKLYKKDVLVFNKESYVGKFDRGDNFNKLNSVIYARNAIWDKAKEVGLDYFIMLDDDYNSFDFRYNDKLEYGTFDIKYNFDRLFEISLKYLEKMGIYCLAWAQAGEFIGGKEGGMAQKIYAKRKIMNVYFCKTDRKFEFFGTLNDDVNTYVVHGNKGKLMFQTNQVIVIQKLTQSNEGGLTDIYLESGTYVKSFYTVMMSPSCVTINLMGTRNRRLHHRISWNNACPKIIREDVCK